MVDMTAHSHNMIICAQSKRWSRMQSTQWQSDVNPVERCQDSFWRLGSYDRQWVVTTVSGHLGSYDLSTVKGFKSRKLISRFRCGCHGLHVDTGRLLPLTQQVPREQRHCVFCASGLAEDEHHFVFDCPAYCAIRSRFTNIFWGPAPTLSSFLLYMIPKS